MATIGTFIYNLSTDIVGGIEVTLADRDLGRIRRRFGCSAPGAVISSLVRMREIRPIAQAVRALR